jgi:hypothetical protein
MVSACSGFTRQMAPFSPCASHVDRSPSIRTSNVRVALLSQMTAVLDSIEGLKNTVGHDSDLFSFFRAEVVASTLRAAAAAGGGPALGLGHPATRTFMALRIAVNEELKSLQIALERTPTRLAPGGRMVVISFHSLEDRLVKQAFRNSQTWECLTRSIVEASAEEVAHNSRSRSARLRAARRLPDPLDGPATG